MNDHCFCQLMLRQARSELAKYPTVRKELTGLSTWSTSHGLNTWFEVYDREGRTLFADTAHCAFDAKSTVINNRIECAEGERVQKITMDMVDSLEPFWRLEGQAIFNSALDWDDDLIEFVEAHDLIGAHEDSIKEAIRDEMNKLIVKAANEAGISFQEMDRRAGDAFDYLSQ